MGMNLPAHLVIVKGTRRYVGSEAHGFAHFTSGHHQGTLYRGAVARGKVDCRPNEPTEIRFAIEYC